MIENRLSKNSSNEELFNKIRKHYSDAINRSGFNYEIKFKSEGEENKWSKKKKKKSNMAESIIL